MRGESVLLTRMRDSVCLVMDCIFIAFSPQSMKSLSLKSALRASFESILCSNFSTSASVIYFFINPSLHSSLCSSIIFVSVSGFSLCYTHKIHKHLLYLPSNLTLFLLPFSAQVCRSRRWLTGMATVGGTSSGSR